MKFSERIAVKYSDVVVADNACIADYVMQEYGVEAVVIAYGGDHIKKAALTNEIQLKYETKIFWFIIFR